MFAKQSWMILAMVLIAAPVRAELIAPQFAIFSVVEAHCFRGARLAPRFLLQSNCGIRV